MTPDFSGKHVVVTGGTGALGRAVVEALLSAGATCTVPYRGVAPAEMPRSERLRLVGAVEPTGGSLAYTIAKAGVVALTRALADEVKGSSVLVNAIIPTVIDTPANRKAMNPSPEALARWSKPADIAAAILWLASADNRVTTGAVIPV